MNEPVPFSTQNAILAFALENAGIPQFRPPTNSFTDEALQNLYRGRGLSLIESLRDAWKRKIRGEVRYWFEKTDELQHFLAAYNDQQAIVDDPKEQRDGGQMVRELMARAAGRDPVTNESIDPMDEREALLRITCVLLKGRAVYLDLWKNLPPRMLFKRDGAIQNVGENRTKHPGFTEIGADFSDERLKELGLL